MICVAPFLSSEAGRSSSATGQGVTRLIKALERPIAEVRPPEILKKRILARVEAEPARVETDRDGGITLVNPAFSALCGFSFAEIKGQKPGSFLQGKKTDAETVSKLRQAIQEQKKHECVMINYHKNGSPYRVKLIVEPVREKNEVTGFKAVAVRLPLD